MQTTMLKLAALPDTGITEAIAAILSVAPGVLAARLSTAGASVAIDFDSAQTSPGRLRDTLALAGIASDVREASASCCGGCCS